MSPYTNINSYEDGQLIVSSAYSARYSLNDIKHITIQRTMTFYCWLYYRYMCRDMTKTSKMAVRPAKTRITLGIRPV